MKNNRSICPVCETGSYHNDDGICIIHDGNEVDADKCQAQGLVLGICPADEDPRDFIFVDTIITPPVFDCDIVNAL